MVGRSIYFEYDKTPSPLELLKDGSIKLSTSGDINNWQTGIHKGKILEIIVPKKDSLEVVKHDSRFFAKALAPDLRLLPIAEPDFTDFLKQEKATKRLTMRFYEIVEENERNMKACAFWREIPQLAGVVLPPLRDSGRPSNWGGVEFSLHRSRGEGTVRVSVSCFPTASLGPMGQVDEKRYNALKKRFEDFLARI